MVISLKKIQSVSKSLIKKSAHLAGMEIINSSYLERLQRASAELSQHDYRFDLDFVLAMPNSKRERILENILHSKSQLRQDLFVLSELDFKSNGFFVEFGAANGIELSNTYLLENRFQWTGILAEPARVWLRSLSINRPHSKIETKCLWRKSDEELLFDEVESAEFSTISDFHDSDFHAAKRINAKRYKVETISLDELLVKWEAPNYIDYLSLDTEGSEFEILDAFNFEKYSFGVITCEHNFSPRRGMVRKLLEKHGYIRKFEGLSKFDDWFVRIH